jgi:hypothetical protein
VLTMNLVADHGHPSPAMNSATQHCRRKRDKQLSFLHLYHHSTMFPLWWIGVSYVPPPHPTPPCAEVCSPPLCAEVCNMSRSRGGDAELVPTLACFSVVCNEPRLHASVRVVRWLCLVQKRVRCSR